ncbi:hypothetical protein OG871_34235 [Kitasatospora sp. NBC_00374]|uniref:hypothetical protein n=1 Tax=Kitasatospora sp. NBC_00374 TaxID=2975964 RepID=UPI0032499ABC
MTRHHARPAPTGPGPRRLLTGLAVAVAGLTAVAACSSSYGGSGGSSTGASSFSPVPSGFSGSPPSALSSLASSAKASVSAAASSLSSAAASFEASVSAELSRSRAAAEAALQSATGQGNAISDVTITGVPRATSGNLNAATVTIVNSSGGTASYAVRVEFLDTSGAVVDSTVVGTENLAAGATATPIAFSRKSPDAALVPRVAQAQRY